MQCNTTAVMWQLGGNVTRVLNSPQLGRYHFFHLLVTFTMLLRPSGTIQQMTDMTLPNSNQ